MKNFIKIFGITAIVAAIGLSFIGCFGSGGSGGGNSSGSRSSGTASVIPDSDFTYELSSDGSGVTVSDYSGPGGNIIFPTEIEGLPIVEFNNRYGIEFNNVTSVVFPDSFLPFFESLNPSFVETKERWEWLGYPDSPTFASAIYEAIQFGISFSIDINADAKAGINGLNPLEKVTFPKGISYIPNNFFESAKSMQSYTIPDTVAFIGRYAFLASGLTSIVIPEGVTGIGEGAFKACGDLKSVTLPESIKIIDTAVFGDCSNLETVNLPSHQIDFSGSVFAGCTKLSLAAQKALRDSGYEGTFNEIMW